jgi:hypothetical protein
MLPVMACPTVPAKPVSVSPAPLPPVSATPLTLAPGHWDWTGHDYVWSPPRWVPRLSNHPMWLDGFWTPNGGACVWTPGHFVQ